jgi:hypothetical protein
VLRISTVPPIPLQRIESAAGRSSCGPSCRHKAYKVLKGSRVLSGYHWNHALCGRGGADAFVMGSGHANRGGQKGTSDRLVTMSTRATPLLCSRCSTSSKWCEYAGSK